MRIRNDFLIQMECSCKYLARVSMYKIGTYIWWRRRRPSHPSVQWSTHSFNLLVSWSIVPNIQSKSFRIEPTLTSVDTITFTLYVVWLKRLIVTKDFCRCDSATNKKEKQYRYLPTLWDNIILHRQVKLVDWNKLITIFSVLNKPYKCYKNTETIQGIGVDVVRNKHTVLPGHISKQRYSISNCERLKQMA